MAEQQTVSFRPLQGFCVHVHGVRKPLAMDTPPFWGKISKWKGKLSEREYKRGMKIDRTKIVKKKAVWGKMCERGKLA
jgi:hypothetical protein